MTRRHWNLSFCSILLLATEITLWIKEFKSNLLPGGIEHFCFKHSKWVSSICFRRTHLKVSIAPSKVCSFTWNPISIISFYLTVSKPFILNFSILFSKVKVDINRTTWTNTWKEYYLQIIAIKYFHYWLILLRMRCSFI